MKMEPKLFNGIQQEGITNFGGLRKKMPTLIEYVHGYNQLCKLATTAVIW